MDSAIDSNLLKSCFHGESPCLGTLYRYNGHIQNGIQLPETQSSGMTH